MRVQLDELPTDVLLNPKDNLLKTSTPRLTPDGQVQLRSQHADIRNSRWEWLRNSLRFSNAWALRKIRTIITQVSQTNLKMDHILLHSYRFTKGLGGRHCESQTTKTTQFESKDEIHMPPVPPNSYPAKSSCVTPRISSHQKRYK